MFKGCRRHLRPDAAPLRHAFREFSGGGSAAFPVPLLPGELHRGRVQSRAEASGVVHTCR